MSLSSRQTPLRTGEPAPELLSAKRRLNLEVRVTPNVEHNSYKVWIAWEGRFCVEVILGQTRNQHVRNVRYIWYYTIKVLWQPQMYRAHELPQAAEFFLEVHRRLSAAIVNPSQFNLDALENPS